MQRACVEWEVGHITAARTSGSHVIMLEKNSCWNKVVRTNTTVQTHVRNFAEIAQILKYWCSVSGYTDIKVEHICSDNTLAQGLVNLFNQQVRNTHMKMLVELKFSSTLTFLHHFVAIMLHGLHSLFPYVAIKQRKCIPNARTEMHRISNLEHISHWRNYKHKYCWNTSIKLTTLNVMSKSVAMNYKMDDKEILYTDSMLVTFTQSSYKFCCSRC